MAVVGVLHDEATYRCWGVASLVAIWPWARGSTLELAHSLPAWKARAEPTADTGCRSSHKTGGGPGRSAGGPECSPASAPQRGTQVCRGDLRVLRAPLLEHRMRTVLGGLAPRLTRGR
jgi:hypothetical protein